MEDDKNAAKATSSFGGLRSTPRARLKVDDGLAAADALTDRLALPFARVFLLPTSRKRETPSPTSRRLTARKDDVIDDAELRGCRAIIG